MLSYIHSYHAGNHADILKHLTLSLILESLCKKEKPFTVFDTHSGSGIYDLDDPRLLRTGEAEGGIEKLMAALDISSESSCGGKKTKYNNLLENGKRYLEIVKKYHDEEKYPGSPFIENEFLRDGDEQILSELHPTAFDELGFCFSSRRKLLKAVPKLHRRDGYEMLKALTPPKIRRGLAVIDPSFEDASDYQKCAKTICDVHKKWPNGIIALWYPILTRKTFELSSMKEKIYSEIQNPDEEQKIFDIQLEVKNPAAAEGLSSMYGSGMLIVNFPYELDKKMNLILPELREILKEKEAATL